MLIWEEQVGGFGLEGDVADFINDEHRVARQADQFGLQHTVVCGREAIDPLAGGGEQHAVTGLAGADPHCL